MRGPGRRFFIVDGGQAKYRLAESQMRTELENVTLGLFEPFFKNNHAYLKELLATQDVGKLRAATGLNESECLSFIDIFSGEITPASAAMVRSSQFALVPLASLSQIPSSCAILGSLHLPI